MENWNKFLSEDQLDEAPKNTISNKLTQKLKNANEEDREKIIIDFFKIIKSGEGYENLFPKWNTQTDEYKAKFIEAGKNFNINKGRAKDFAKQIIAATTPQEIESGVVAVIDAVEDQTGLDIDATASEQPSSNTEAIDSDNHYQHFTDDNQPTDDLKAIKKAHRKLAMKNHPDHGGSGEVMNAISMMFADLGGTIGDEQRKQVYDQGLYQDTLQCKADQEKAGKDSNLCMDTGINIQPDALKRFAQIAGISSTQSSDNPEDIKSKIQDAGSQEEKIEILGAEAAKIADNENKPTEEAAKEVILAIGMNPQPEIVQAVEDAADKQEPETDAKVSTDVIKKFADFFIKNNLVKLQEALKDILEPLGIDTKQFGQLLAKAIASGEFTKEEVQAFNKHVEGDNAAAFVDQIRNMAQSTTTDEPAKEGEVEVEVGGREYTYTDENIQKLKAAYEAFEETFMTVLALKEQEDLWIELRKALNNIGKFRPIAKQETSLSESINIFEQENQAKVKTLIRDLERLRKDFNDTDKTLAGYVKKATEGQYEAAAYMARFLGELKDVQNSIGRAVEDTKSVVGIEPLEEILREQEEETREEKIQNVRNVYENIKDLLGGALPEIGRNVEGQFQEISGNIKQSYEELQKIRKYFRRVGAFAKTSDMDVEEIEQDYLFIKKNVSKVMSRFIDDLRRGNISKQNAASFLKNIASIGDFILSTFGVGPDEGYGYKVIEIPSDGKDKEEIIQDTDDTGAQPLNPEGEEEVEDAEVELEDEPESLEDLFTQVRKFIRSPQTQQFVKMAEEMVNELSKPAPGTQQLLTIVNKFRSKMTGNLEEQLTDEQMGIRYREMTSLIDELRKNFTKSSPKLFVKSIQQDNRKYADVYKAYFKQVVDLYKSLFNASKSFEEKSIEKANAFLDSAEKQISQFGQKVAKTTSDKVGDILNALANKVPDFFGIEDVKNLDFSPKSKEEPDDSPEIGSDEEPSPDAGKDVDIIDQDDQQTEVDPEAVTLADPTQLMDTEISDLTANIKKYAPKRGPVKQEVARALIEKDEQFKDYYARFLALLSGLNAMRLADNEDPKQIKKVITDIYKSVHGNIDYDSQPNQLEEQSEPPSILDLQKLTLKMFLMLKKFTTQTDETQLQKFYKLYQKALMMIRKLKNSKNDLKYIDNDDDLMTVLNNTEYFRPNARPNTRMIGSQDTEIVPDEELPDYDPAQEVPEPDKINKDKKRKKQKAAAKEKSRRQKIRRRSKTKRNSGDYSPERSTRYMGESKENLLEKLIKEEIRSLHGKKMVRN
jgi:hypothetical protein